MTHSLIRSLAVCAALLPALSACSAPQEQAASTAPSTSASGSAPAAAQAPEQTAAGQTTEQEATEQEAAAPKTGAASRVVALEYSYMDMLAALGVTPVGGTLDNVGTERGAPAYLQPYLEGVQDVGSRAQPSLEAVTALRPDLILAESKVHSELLGSLEAIAPTQAYDNRSASYADVLEQLQDVAERTGRQSEAARVLERQQSLMNEARALVSPGAPAVLIGVATAEGFWVHSAQSFAGSLLSDLGRPNVAQAQGDKAIYELSLEGLAALNPPTLVLMTGADETPVTATWADNPLWQKLKAVERGRVYEVDRDLWSRSRGPLAVELMLGDMQRSGLLADEAPAEGFQPR